MSIFKVTLTEKRSDGRNLFLNFDCNLPDVEAFHADLTEKGAVYGEYLFTGPTDDQGRKSIIERRPRIIGVGSIHAVEPATIRFTENGEPVA